MPSPAWICAPRSTSVSVCSDAGERIPSACASSKRSFTLLSFFPSFDLMTSPLQPDARPAFDRIRGADDVHPGICEAGERLLRLRGEIGGEATLAVRHRHRGHAVSQDVDLACQHFVLRDDLVEQIIDGALHAVAGGLAG